mmetsp:Transcript_30830/g.60333  ORF Transcript_30830/g.60333 Transcript_30830/m.60333 type:complete len:829 (-) Transcript_30830:742-3228(-)
MVFYLSILFDAFELVLAVLVELAQTVDVVLAGLPVPTAVGLEEGLDHVAERVGVGVQQALLHRRVADEHVVCVLVHEVVHGAGRGGPAHGVTQALGDLTSTLVTLVQHTLVELGVEELGASVKAHGLGQGAHLGVGGRGVRDEGGGLLAVLAEALDHLGGVGVEVVRDVREGDLRGVEVLEGDIDLGQGRLEDGVGLLHLAGAVGVEGERLALQELLLELALVLPAAVLDGQADVGAVASGGVGEDARGGRAEVDAELLGLLDGVLTHEVLVEGLVGLGSHLHGAVEEVHLVDEEVPEDARAGDDGVDTRAAELLERDQAKLVHAPDAVRDGLNADQPHGLREGLTVRLDVVGTPQGEGHGLRPDAAVVDLLALHEAVHDDLRALDSRGGRDRLRVEGVHVLSGGQHLGVTDGVASGARGDVLAVERGHEAAQLVVSHDLLEAEPEVLEQRSELALLDLEAELVERLAPWGLDSDEALEGDGKRVDRLDAPVRVGALHGGGLDGGAGGLHDLLAERHVLEHTVVRVAVDLLDVPADALGNQAREGLETVLGAVERGDVNQGGHGLLHGWGHADGVEPAWEQAGLDLHELVVHLTDDAVALVQVHVLRVVLFGREVLDVLVQVARARGGDNRVDDVGAAAGVPQALVGANELAELLQALVQASVLRGRGEVRDGGGVATAFGDGSLRRVVSGVVVQVRERVDQAVRVALAGHTHLLSGHELQGSVGSEVQDGVGAEDLLKVGVVGGETVVGRGRLGEEEAHGVALVTEGGLDADEDVAELLTVHEQVLAVGVEVAGRRAPVVLEVLRVGGQLAILVHVHAVGHVELRGG